MASKRVVRDGDALVKGSTYKTMRVSKAYSDMIKFEDGSQMWVDPGQIIDGWYFNDGAHASAPQAKDCKPRGVTANQILLHMSMPGLSWSTGPSLLLPPDVTQYMHEDGTPISIRSKIDLEASWFRATPEGGFILEDKAYSLLASTIARRIFDADSRTKLAMSKLEVPQNDRAYARGIFGYQPEASWAADAWALTEEITK